MKILFSPSEEKRTNGENSEINILGGTEIRKEILYKYQKIIEEKNLENIKKLFGIKKEKDLEPYLVDIFDSPLLKAVQRYSGVAFKYLKYESLNDDAKEYIDNNTLIFSNLFGAIRAKDTIPLYKVKQGNDIGGIKPEVFYQKKVFFDLIEKEIENEDILDLRAGYYEKFYKIKQNYTTLKFLKNDKIVSHFAKAYRGIVLKECALHNIKTVDDLKKLDIPNLVIKEIKHIKNKQEIIYEIKE